MPTLLRVLDLLFTTLVRLLDLLLRTLARAGRYWANDMRRRKTTTGKAASFAVGMFALLCACSLPLSLLRPTGSLSGAQVRAAAAGSSGDAAHPRDRSGTSEDDRPSLDERATEAPSTPQPEATATQRPTTPPTPSVVPTAMVPAPPLAQADRVANVRSAPRVADDTVLAKLCPGDALEYVSMQQVGDELWFRVRVAATGPDCDPRRAPLGTEGWAAASVVAAPSYDVRRYAAQMGFALPTTIPPTAVPTRAPTARPVAPPPVAPQRRCDPSYPDFCLPIGIGDLNCPDIPYRRFRVVGRDPHGFDRDNDGIGCES